MLTVCDDMTADSEAHKTLKPIVAEIFTGGGQITQHFTCLCIKILFQSA